MTTDAEWIIGLYERHADVWARDRGDAGVEAGWIDRFFRLLPARPAVLDIGCGSGRPIARTLIGQGCRVTGVDSSPAMIAMCRAALPEGDWQVADMRGLALDRSFDGILAWDSLFHLTADDQRRMFPIFRRHAAPDAVLMFTSGPRHGEAIGRYRGEPLYHASLDAAEYRDLLAANGFAVIAHVPEDPTCGGHTIWLVRQIG